LTEASFNFGHGEISQTKSFTLVKVKQNADQNVAAIPCPIEMRWKVKRQKRRVFGGKSARGTGSTKQLNVDQKQNMKAEGRWEGSGARVTSGQLVGLVLQQQGEDEPDQLTSGQDEGAAMFETHGFAILAR
jgi:hypothetical protein